jgi:predicted transcriptional regulator
MTKKFTTDALISIKPEYVEKIICGAKSVEIRTRQVAMPNNIRLWIYSTLPKATIQAFTFVEMVDIGAPETIWEKYSTSIGISKECFNEYVNGSKKISAIVTKKTSILPIEISLSKIRSKVSGFSPPQFYKLLKKDDPILIALKNILREEYKIGSGPLLAHVKG